MSAPTRGLPRLLAGLTSRPMSLAEHVGVHGELPAHGDLLSELDRAGLVGHGGGAFRTAAGSRGWRRTVR